LLEIYYSVKLDLEKNSKKLLTGSFNKLKFKVLLSQHPALDLNQNFIVINNSTGTGSHKFLKGMNLYL
jgi:hypothetical protein